MHGKLTQLQEVLVLSREALLFEHQHSDTLAKMGASKTRTGNAILAINITRTPWEIALLIVSGFCVGS